MKAYCRNCEAVTSHRFHNSEVVCDLCDWIGITFHEPVSITVDAPQERPKECTCDPRLLYCQCGHVKAK